MSDQAGNSASATATISLDRAAPVVTITSPADGAVVSASPVAVTSSVSDLHSGAASATCAGAAATVAGSSVTCQVAIQRAQAITVSVTDRAGNVGSSTVNVGLAGANNGVPISRAGGPYSGSVQTALGFSGATSSDPDGDALTYAWDFGDGGTATGVSPTHAYAAAGVYTVALTARDPIGATHTSTTTATITRANHAPTAVPGGPYTADLNAPVPFDASASTDPDGDLLTYTWEFGDGGTGTGNRPRRSYLTPGTFTAKLKVSDGFGGVNSATVQVTIRAANQTPTANPGGPYRGLDGPGGGVQRLGVAGSRRRSTHLQLELWRRRHGDGAGRVARLCVGRLLQRDADGQRRARRLALGYRAGADCRGQRRADGECRRPLFRTRRPRRVVRRRTVVGSRCRFAHVCVVVRRRRKPNRSSAAVHLRQRRHLHGDADGVRRPRRHEHGQLAGHDHDANVQRQSRAGGKRRRAIQRRGGDSRRFQRRGVERSGRRSSCSTRWTFGDGGTAAGVLPKHTFATPGTYPVSLAVSDGHGGSHTSTASAVIAPQADRIPPSVQLSGPTRVLPGTTVTLTAAAMDNVAIASVTFGGHGGTTTVTTPPYQRTVTIPAVASPGSTIDVNATATDSSGNTRTASLRLTIIAQPDATPPTVSLSVPAQTAPGAILRVGASASDASGVETVTFRIGGDTKTVAGAPYSAAFQIPASAPPGTPLTVLVDAVDFAGNHGTAESAVAVVAAPDATPPSVHVVAPATTRAGAAVALAAQAADAGGVSAVTLLVNGVPVATLTAAPYQTTFEVPGGVVAGMHLLVEARAVDFAGLQAIDTASIEVLDPAGGEAVVTGEVYDDTTGLSISGASVALLSPDGPASATTTSDERGRYALGVLAGDVLVRVTKPGWTTVDRPLSVGAGPGAGAVRCAADAARARAAHHLPRARRHPRRQRTCRRSVPPGALGAEAALTLTRVGAQGLRGMLPAGWSPVAPFELAPAGVTFLSPATVRAPRNGVAQGTPLVFAAWEPQRRGWRALSASVAGPATELLRRSIDGVRALRLAEGRHAAGAAAAVRRSASLSPAYRSRRCRRACRRWSTRSRR